MIPRRHSWQVLVFRVEKKKRKKKKKNDLLNEDPSLVTKIRVQLKGTFPDERASRDVQLYRLGTNFRSTTNYLTCAVQCNCQIVNQF